jgi:adenosylhomocysteine nucleosidase
MKDTLVITPLEKELLFFLAACVARGWHWESTKIGRLPVYYLPEPGLWIVKGGTGKVQFGVQTQHLMDNTPPWDLVICAGAAGALSDDLAIGDVIVGTSTVEHDYQNKFNERPRPIFKGADFAIESLQDLSYPAGFSVYFGRIASGDEDIVTTERGRELREMTGALVAAWEGAGGAKACLFSQTPFLEIRGVTDTADHNAATDFEANLETAMGHVAALITTWLQRIRHGGK